MTFPFRASWGQRHCRPRKTITLVATMAMAVFCGQAPVAGQITAFQTGFEYDSEPIVFQPSDLNGAQGQIGTWSGDEFPEGIGHIAPDSVGFVDGFDGGRVMLLDRALTPTGDPGTEILSYFADLSEDLQTVGATVSFDAGTVRTQANQDKDWDVIGLDSSGNESFHLRIGTNNNGGERLGVVTDGDVATFDLPTISGEDLPTDLDNIGVPPFADDDEIGSIRIRMGAAGYSIDFENFNNAYTTDSIPYNGSATELSQIQLTYAVSDQNPMQSGYILDNILVTGFTDILLGDFNGDSQIDNTDFVILAENFGTGTSYGQGDMNFDGTVNIPDFVEFKRVFHAGGGGMAASVPEPSGLALVTLLGLWMSSVRCSAAKHFFTLPSGESGSQARRG